MGETVIMVAHSLDPQKPHGVWTSQRAADARLSAGSKEVKPSRHWVVSFVIGILLALLIVAGAFILLVSQQ
jgi:hypothetical protein